MENTTNNPRQIYKRIVNDLKTTGESDHECFHFELDDTSNICEVYDKDGEFLFYLENVTEIYHYCIC